MTRDAELTGRAQQSSDAPWGIGSETANHSARECTTLTGRLSSKGLSDHDVGKMPFQPS